jgi:hypothetical protein
MHYKNIQNQLTDSLSTRLTGNMINMGLGHPTIIALTISTLFLVSLWADNVYALNNYTKPALSAMSPPNKLSSITITSNSNSVYSIPSTSVQVVRFSTNYVIDGRISSLNNSRNLIASTIMDDFDKNPNIGYIVNGSSSNDTLAATSASPAQPSLPNPFVSKNLINQKISNEIQDAIAAASSTSSTQKRVEIRCTFGMILSDYRCS